MRNIAFWFVMHSHSSLLALILSAATATDRVSTAAAKQALGGAVYTNVSAQLRKPHCKGSSKHLELQQCRYLQEQFRVWNMTQYREPNGTLMCPVDDPCACKPYEGRVTCEGKSVTKIDFESVDEYQPLAGTICNSIGALTDLKYLDIGVNEIHGTLPESIFKLTQLQYLSLTDNYLTGTLPPSIGDLHELRSLAIDHNHLTGSVPASFGALTDTLKVLAMYCNQFTGVLPSIDWANITVDPTSPTGRDFDCFLSPRLHQSCTAPFTSNEWACPLPTDAAEFCKAVCKGI